ncbi:MAG: S49 family peptidase [Candidatus Puniceispirillales bacterium]
MIRFLLRPFRSSRPVVPVIRLQGVIAASSTMRRGLSMAGLAPVIDRAFNQKGAKAVALVINSPGGSPVQSALIAGRIRHLSKAKNIPVISFVEDVAASGGYWLACAGDEIIVNPASVVGSIGVVSAGFGFDKAIEKIGVSRRVYTAGTRKGMLDPFSPESPDDIAHLKGLQQDIHDQFITMVKRRRGSRLAGEDADLFSGAFWTGQASISLGLADKTGELRQELENRFGEKVDIRLMQPKRSLLGLGGGGVSGALADASVDSLIDALTEKLERSRFGL